MSKNRSLTLSLFKYIFSLIWDISLVRQATVVANWFSSRARYRTRMMKIITIDYALWTNSWISTTKRIECICAFIHIQHTHVYYISVFLKGQYGSVSSISLVFYIIRQFIKILCRSTLRWLFFVRGTLTRLKVQIVRDRSGTSPSFEV